MRVLLVIVVVMLTGCATSPGNGAVGLVIGDRYKPTGEFETWRGVVNGLYRLNPDETLADLDKYDDHLSAEDRQAISARYVVRVGVNRSPGWSVLSPVVIGAKWLDYVVLPEGWSHSAGEISRRENVINVGDIIDVEVERGRRFDFAVTLVRKCYDDPEDDENPDWAIGCKTYDEFSDRGYAGERYMWRTF